MTVAETKARLAELLEVSKQEADNVLWALNEICSETIQNGGFVTLPGIGKLSCSVRAARKARNPRTGESVNVPAKVAVRFSLSKGIKDQAPSLKSRAGKALLEEAEAKQRAAAKRKRLREREEAEPTTRKRTTVKKRATVSKSKRLSRT